MWEEALSVLRGSSAESVEISLGRIGAMLDDIPQKLLHQDLLHLNAAGLLYEAGLYPETLYALKHALVEEVAYNALPNERRRYLHAAVVKAIV